MKQIEQAYEQFQNLFTEEVEGMKIVADKIYWTEFETSRDNSTTARFDGAIGGKRVWQIKKWTDVHWDSYPLGNHCNGDSFRSFQEAD